MADGRGQDGRGGQGAHGADKVNGRTEAGRWTGAERVWTGVWWTPTDGRTWSTRLGRADWQTS